MSFLGMTGELYDDIHSLTRQAGRPGADEAEETDEDFKGDPLLQHLFREPAGTGTGKESSCEILTAESEAPTKATSEALEEAAATIDTKDWVATDDVKGGPLDATKVYRARLEELRYL